MGNSGDVRLTMALLEEGCDAGMITRRRDRGEITRVRHGAYTAALGHDSAAVLHDLPSWPVGLSRVHITRSRSSGGRRTQNLHVHTGTLDADDVTLIDGLPCTSVARTVADLARTLPLNRAVAVADLGLRQGLSRQRLHEQWELSRLRTGAAQLRFVASFADNRAESVGESFSRLIIHQVRLPPPELQYKIFDPATGRLLARCDFGWEEHRTVGEFDGRIKYGRLLKRDQDPGDVVFAEKAREDLIRDQGHSVARWINADLERSTLLRQRILRAFARGDRWS